MDGAGNNPICLDLDINDFLTGISIGNIIVDIIKYIAYGKLQIPYPYVRLKHIIHNRKLKELEDCPSLLTLQSLKHFRIASSALNALDAIFHNILLEIDSPQPPREVCIVLGATPMTGREVYQIVLPDVLHKTCYHSNGVNTQRKQAMSVLRTIATSEVLEPMVYSTLPPTNMYVLLKRHSHWKSTNGPSILNDTFFTPINSYKLSRKTKLAIIQFKQNSSLDCERCNFKIFEDNNTESKHTGLVNNEVLKCDDLLELGENQSWFLSSQVVKGFKDCYINGQSVTDMW